MPEEENPLVKMQISMARMEGMLTQALADHTTRIAANQTQIDTERNRVTAVENIVSQHTIMITNTTSEVKNLHEKLTNSMPRTIMVITGIAACLGIVLSLVSMFMNGQQ